MLVLLVANRGHGPKVGAAVVEQLARLGVTDLAVLRDEQTTAVSLSGWAFDPARSADAAARAVAADGAVQVLRPVLESAIHRLPSDSRGGGADLTSTG